ncbi:FAD-dependent monooxygenase [Natronoflexus pectinivorans]|uniref:2-polyprenyl-6-methoxyphenol hydroxylase-like FAD-dependent oxidoreductase n=1 Tax=Natronoflexus pectinivorans TaxID=682526 RepID=A0A4R2GP10_9BACT|nr:FAD-dependent monooxygenase [Natronoflexus pectinivorans]TCO11075.1 2-polyprenyl-6-methoxyphenol hydroxylase-like FAD-dependent oxidoreductase [Natronoflexus pectinivorans]
MAHSPHNTTEVLIVGAGPTGLMMACQLALHQVSFRIIDKNTASSQNSGALIVQARTLEIFEQLGIASEAITEGIIADKIDVLYNGEKIASTSIKDIGRNLSQFPFLLMLEQSKTEQLMLKFLEKHGCNVERNVRLNSFEEDENRIITGVTMPDGYEQTITSKYLIGADGSRSAVRNSLNIPFNGISYPMPIFIIDCGFISRFSSEVIYFDFSKKSVAGFFPLRNQRWRVDGSFPGKAKKTNNITLETVTKGLRNWNNLNFDLHNTEWFSVSHSQQKYARNIRIGNCFLAGDSAHVNTPVGAQGMNTGLQDAHNLAWKMAFVLKQKANPELLDSYSTERLGISKGFAQYADAIFRLVTNTNLAVRLFRTFVLKSFFKRIFPKLENNEKSRLMFFKSISQIDIHYKPNYNTYKDLEKPFSRETPKPGYRLPYIDFTYENKNTNSHQILNASAYTLLVFAEELTPEIQSISDKYELTTVLLKHLPETDTIYKILGIAHTGYYLIRPDMYIEIRSATTDTENLNSHLNRLLLKIDR